MSKITDFAVSIPGGAATSRKNAIINGNFDIWQRGISATTSAYNADDRWRNIDNGATKTTSRQTFTVGQTDVPNNPKYYSRTITTTGGGIGNYARKDQYIEGVNTFSGEEVTLSFWAKASTTLDMSTEFYQWFGSGGSPSTQVKEIGVTKHSLTTSWQKFTVTTTIPSISGKTLGTDGDDWLGIYIWMDAGSDFNSRTDTLGNQSGTFDIAQVQLEKGSFATDFEKRMIGEELALCQRYFCKSYAQNIDPGTASTSPGRIGSRTDNTGTVYIDVRLPQTMRAIPTITNYSSSSGNSGVGSVGASDNVSASSNSVCETGYFVAMSGTSNAGALFHYTADAEL